MSISRLNLSGGLSCSALGFGMMGFGGRHERDESNDASAVTVIRCAIDLGIDLFDTAEIYGAGHSEEVLGSALRGQRQKAVIASKFSAEHSNKEAMIAACEGSLKRLGTDYIDIYQTHWPNPAVPLEEIVAGFEHLIKNGKIRAAGFSNATAALMKKVVALLPLNFPLATSQQEYNLSERFVERDILPFCRSKNMALLAYSPLEQGKLIHTAGQDVLASLAMEYATTPAAIALQWLMQHANVIPIPMTSNIHHLKENVAALAKPIAVEALTKAATAFSKTITEIPVTAIQVIGSHTGKAYTNLRDARINSLNLSPSPVELARELASGEMLKPVKLRAKRGVNGQYELFEGQLRYWAWRIAHNDQLPILAQLC